VSNRVVRGVSAAGLTTTVQLGGKSGRDVTSSHGQREVPRRDEKARHDRMLRDEHPARVLRIGAVAPLYARCRLTEPAQKFTAVGALTAGLG
jgi:hypothetical protein